MTSRDARGNGVCAIASSLGESFNSYRRYEMLLPNGEVLWLYVSQILLIDPRVRTSRLNAPAETSNEVTRNYRSRYARPMSNCERRNGAMREIRRSFNDCALPTN